MMLQLTLSPPCTSHWMLDAPLAWCLDVLRTYLVKFIWEGNDYLVWRTLQFKFLLWRSGAGYETTPVLYGLWIKTIWRSSATCQGKVEGEGGFLNTSSPISKSRGAHRFSHHLSSCANSDKTKWTKTLRWRGFQHPVRPQSLHVKQEHAMLRADHSSDEESQTLIYVPSFKHFNSPIKYCGIS